MKINAADPKSTIDTDELGHPCGDENCFQCHACQTLKETINQLHSALAEQSEVDRRVRELENDVNDSPSTGSDDRAADEVIDFEAEYREVEGLVRELKKVLVVDGCPLIRDASLALGEGNRNESESVDFSLPLIARAQWNQDDEDDETVSMVTSPDSEVDSPALAALNGRSRSLEISEQYLRQQVGISPHCLNSLSVHFHDF